MVVDRLIQDVKVLARAGVLGPIGPHKLAPLLRSMRRWDRTLAGAAAAGAIRYPDRVAVIDDEGELTFGDLHRRTNAITRGLAARGVRPREAVGLLARDSRCFVEAVVAVSKLGADLVLLNTGFSGPQLRDVAEREGLVAIVHDHELADVAQAAPAVTRLIATESLALLAAEHAGGGEPPAPDEPGRQRLLTSGTTGTPKGARRPPTTPIDTIVGFLSRIPVRSGGVHAVVAPMFHAWGFAHAGLCLMLGCTVVVTRRFDPEGTLELVAKHRPRLLALVPVMAQRILALPPEVRARYDTSSLEIAALGGSAIPGDLATRFMDAFGDVAYNTYGSTEVAVVSIATPRDLRAAPDTAGRPVDRIVVRLLDADGREVPPGEAGRIFVGSGAAFEGYTGGTSKEVVDGLMATGDVGRFDAAGRLTVEGRDDDMIVSGGENVFPREVEDVIAGLDGVVEVAVLGVPDDEFGQRLNAYVVTADGRPTADEIRASVKARLARYKVPRDVVFLDELPRTATGKILKRALAEARPSRADPAP